MFSLNKGLLTPEIVTDLKSLTFSEEEKDVLGWLHEVTSRFRFLENIVFVLFAFYSFISIVIFILATKIEALPKSQIVLLFAFYLVLGIFIYSINVFGAGRAMNTYTRIIGTVFDNILQSIYDTYTVSLAHLITKHPTPKAFSGNLSIGALAASNYQSSISQIIGVFLGLVFAFIFGLIVGDGKALAISIFGFGLVFMFLLFMHQGRRYVKTEENLSRYSDLIDQMYSDRKSLLFSNQNLINEGEFRKFLNRSVNATTYINLTTYFVKFIVPIILVFVPFLLGDAGNLFVVAAACLFITMKVFSQTTAASNYNSVAISEIKVRQLADLYETIKKVGAELTPEKYENKKAGVVKKAFSTADNFRNGLVIKNLSFVVGRGEEKRTIGLPELFLDRKKVHFLYGKSGAGKSVFGRIMTLRYADFDADEILLNGSDIRTYSSLQAGLLELHFSSLRHITTSYRHAISIYVSKENNFVGLKEYAVSLKVKSQRMKNFFKKHSKYYEGLDTSKFAPSKARDMLENLTNEELEEVSKTLRYSDWKNVSNERVLLSTIFLEYASFKYLKIFIPDATLYFVDAILSEPPISQGQRRRIILALDLLVKGKVFVADEPFANLDDKNSVNILNLLVSYAKENEAVVLVLDQKDRLSGVLKEVKRGKTLHLTGEKIEVEQN